MKVSGVRAFALVCISFMTQVIWAGPYVVKWRGVELPLHDVRISSVPFCRVWPGHQREKSQTEIAHFVRFDVSDSGELEICSPQVVCLLERILPLDEASALVREGGDVLRIRVSRPGGYVLQFAGLPDLHVFADPPLPPVPEPGPGGRLIRFGRGEHRPGVVAPQSGDVVVLDEGAVVYGSLFILNATNVTVTGRGIFDGSDLERSDETMRAFRRERGLPEIDTESACFAYSIYGSENVSVSGVTFRDPPFWTLVVRNQCRHTLIDNIHIVGNWRYNSDGVDVCSSEDTVIRNSFLRTFDDCVIARGPYMKGEYAPVNGLVITNCSLFCDWGVPFKAQVQDFHGSTIENVLMRDCRILSMREVGLFLAVRYGSDLNILRNLTFEDLEFNFYPQPCAMLQKEDGDAFVAKPLKKNTLAVAFSYTLGKNLDNQQNGMMEDPAYYHFIYDNFAFRRFRVRGENRDLDMKFVAKVPRHEFSNISIEGLPPCRIEGLDVVWEGRVLPVRRTRISAMPFNRVWTGRQRPLDQTRMARYVTFDMPKAGTLAVALPEKADGVEVFPLSLRERVTVTNGSVRVALGSPRHFVLDFGPRAEPLHVFANPPSGPCPRDGKVRRFGPGVHEAGVIVPESGETVWLDEGAVVKGAVFVDRVHAVRIAGRGVFDFSGFTRCDPRISAVRRDHGLPAVDTEFACGTFVINASTNVTVEGVTLDDAPFWNCIVRGGSKDVLIDNVKIIGAWRYNSDGIDVAGADGVTVRNCFVRAFDDGAVVLDGYLDGRSLDTRNVTFEDTVFWNDWGVSFKLWGGKFSGVHENIVFRRNVLARVAARAFAIRSHLGCPSWTARNVRIEDIEIDTTEADPVPRLQGSDAEVYVGGRRDALSLYELELGWPMADTGNQGRRRMTEEEAVRTSKTIEDVAFRRISVKGRPVRLMATRRTCGPNQTIRNVVLDDMPHVEETVMEFEK